MVSGRQRDAAGGSTSGSDRYPGRMCGEVVPFEAALKRGSNDTLVCRGAEVNDAILVAFDKDMKAIAKRLGIGLGARIAKRCHRVPVLISRNEMHGQRRLLEGPCPNTVNSGGPAVATLNPLIGYARVQMMHVIGQVLILLENLVGVQSSLRIDETSAGYRNKI